MKRKKINYQLLLRRVCLIVLDIVLIIISSLMALLTRFEFDIEQIPEEFLDVLVSYGILMIVINLCYGRYSRWDAMSAQVWTEE